MADIIKTVKDELTLENVLALAMKTPGVKINRSKFLRKELLRYCNEKQINEAIHSNPAKAGISKKTVNKMAKAVIGYETKKVTAISFAASLPGGGWAVGAASADIVSYFAHMIRVVQKLAYLYGFGEFEITEDNMDSQTLDQLLVFMGVMFGVEGANKVLQKVADNYAKYTAKNLAQKALTKTFYYPIIKKIATKVGIHINKQIFADAVASTIPVIGGFASGGLTYLMFKPNCEKLQKTLQTYNICDPDFYKNCDDIIDAEIVDAVFDEDDFEE